MKIITFEALISLFKEQWLKYCDLVIAVKIKYWETDNFLKVIE